MTTRNIEPGSLLHGLLNSDFDNFLLYRYNELLKAIGDVISDKPSDKDKRFIDLLKNSLQRHIADNNRIIRDLQINVENEHIKEGFVSLNRVRLNNLQSVNEKSECLIRDLEGLRRVKAGKKNPLSAPVIALFCKLLHESGFKKRDTYNETITNYCIRICENYNLTYTDRVRQNFNPDDTPTPRNITKVKELIFPLIDEATKEAITEYLNSKQPPQQKLYA